MWGHNTLAYLQDNIFLNHSNSNLGSLFYTALRCKKFYRIGPGLNWFCFYFRWTVNGLAADPSGPTGQRENLQPHTRANPTTLCQVEATGDRKATQSPLHLVRINLELQWRSELQRHQNNRLYFSGKLMSDIKIVVHNSNGFQIPEPDPLAINFQPFKSQKSGIQISTVQIWWRCPKSRFIWKPDFC